MKDKLTDFDSKKMALVPKQKDDAVVEQESMDIIKRVKHLQKSATKELGHLPGSLHRKMSMFP